jgi:hypothetical protein
VVAVIDVGVDDDSLDADVVVVAGDAGVETKEQFGGDAAAVVVVVDYVRTVHAPEKKIPVQSLSVVTTRVCRGGLVIVVVRAALMSWRVKVALKVITKPNYS